MKKSRQLVLFVAFLFSVYPIPAKETKMESLLGSANLTKWKNAAISQNQPQWTLTKGVFEGHNSWVAFSEVFTNFVLECDINFNGKAEGGIAFRADAQSQQPWRDGYELDIDWAADRIHGHIHFPTNPKPSPGEALIDVDKWYTVRIEAKGKNVDVFLDNKKVLSFSDQQFLKGNICLEGHEGGVKYRNIRIDRLK